jgi:hypothetical protein
VSEGETPRPRPQFGEYASPEEQRARIQQPDATWALETGQSLDDPATPPAPPTSAPAPVQTPAATASPRPRRIDRIATFALLGYGLFTVLTSIPSLADYSGYVDTLLGVMGVEAEYSVPAGAQIWGVAAALVLGLGWIATAALSWTNLRRGRLTWWIPLTAGVVFNLIAGGLMLVPIMSDPALWNALMAGVTG